ncbi:hypothetical protein ACS5PU_02420 [Pedobacter sp. GSP4]|uniref:hypothetical protein n=1 Tax=Pedobacter sp. GSP4 TaxID=3453716 RepID=UPI003EE86A29
MRDIAPPFELNLRGSHLQISEHELAGKRIFRIKIENGPDHLIIAVAINASGKKFWTSIPEGRQKEATEIGKLIAEHIRANRR